MIDRKKFFYFAIFPALFFQLIGALFYFVVFKDKPIAPIIYMFTKVLIVLWPLLWITPIKYHFKSLPKKSAQSSFLYGLVSGLVIFGAIAGVYFLFQDYFDGFSVLIEQKAVNFGILNHYLWFALFFSLIHSLIEEYYWRWFVFKGLIIKFSPLVAAVIGSIAFSSHHYVVLSEFFSPLVTFLLGTAVGLGGLIWCYLYFKTGKIWVSWLSHVLVDLSIMWVGYWIMF